MKSHVMSFPKSESVSGTTRAGLYVMYAAYMILYIPSFISKSLDIPHWYTISSLIILLISLYHAAQILTKRKFTLFRASLFLLLLFPVLITSFTNQSLVLEAFIRFIRTYAFFLFVLYLHLKYSAEDAIRIIFYSLFIILFMNFASMVIHPEGLYHTETNGIFETTVKNEPGFVRNQINRVHWLLGHQTTLIRYILPGMLYACLLYCISAKGKPNKVEFAAIVLLFVICLIQIIIANSASNYIGIVLLISLVLIRRLGISINPLIIIGAAFCIYLIVDNIDNSAILQFISDILNRPVKLSTRTPIWQGALEYILKSPFAGYGYIDETSLEIRNIFGLGNPHSTYLWAMFEGGLFEFILLVTVIYCAYSGTSGSRKAIYSDFCYASVVTLSTLMIIDDYIYRDVYFILILYAAYSCKQYSQTISEEEHFEIEESINSTVNRGRLKSLTRD